MRMADAGGNAEAERPKKMSKLGNVVEAVEKYNQFVESEVRRARTDKKFGQQMLARWNEIKAKIPDGTRADRIGTAASGAAGD